MRPLRPQLAGADLAVLLAGGAATLLVAYLSVHTGAKISVGALLVAAFFVVAVIGFIAYPHLAVGATVLLFPLIPALKVLVWSDIGPVKDLVVVAAVTAAAIVYAFERRRPDRWVLVLVGLLLGLYVINVGSGHGIAWAQGVRLVGEPLLLLLVGMILPQPRRTFQYAMGALVVICCVVAAYGIVQQLVGEWTLVGWGYSFSEQVRTAYGHLRSFGTLDEPFDYAGVLSLGVAAVFFWLRRGPLAWAAGSLILLGLGASLVRTSILYLVGLIGLALWRWGNLATAMLLAVATLIAGGVVLANTSGTESQTYAVAGSGGVNGTGGSANVILNGRVSAWSTALGPNPADWVLGRGVGEVGTAAQRATYSLTPSSDSGPSQSQAVDSGYLATVADVGIVGLAVLLALFGRLIGLGAAAAREGQDAGWVALGLLVVVLISATTGASFTSFPNAFLAMLLVGLALAAAREESESSPGPVAGNR